MDTYRVFHEKAIRAIQERCPRCEYGFFEGRFIRCTYWAHPGYVGGYGTEWAATCDSFVDSGKIGRLKSTVAREA